MLKQSLILLVLLSAGISAQTNPSPPPGPQPTPNTALEWRKQMEERRERNEKFERLDDISARNSARRPIPKGTLLDIKGIYRDATSKEVKALPPHDDDLQKFKAFLRQKNTGIVRLADTSECSDSAFVISAATKCLEFRMPGSGAYYSFRKAGYSIDRLADIRYKNGVFSVTGVMQHGILTGLGDIDPDSVTLQTSGMGYLVDFVPSKDMISAPEAGRVLAAGVDRDGFHYRQGLNAIKNMTYGLRSVAYRGSVPRSFNGYVYDELDFDKRIDVIVVFRVIRVHDDGSATIVWKRLQKQRSPKLKLVTEPSGPIDSKFTAASTIF